MDTAITHNRMITQKKLASIIGVSVFDLCKILNGKKKVTRDSGMRLERETGIPMTVWFGGHRGIRTALEKKYGRINFKVGRPRVVKG